MATWTTSFTTLTLSEYRSLTIFTSYLLLNLSLTLFLTSTLLTRFTALPAATRARLPTLRLALFIFLTLASLAATWYHMFAFFAHSYRAHLSRAHPTLLAADHLAALPPLARLLRLVGIESLPEQRLKAALNSRVTDLPLTPNLIAAWLNQSTLFREAWESACSTPARYWWTQQIFGLTAGWAVFLGWNSRRMAVRYAPLFMVLAQLVAVSFAMNLFFVAVLLSAGVTDNTTEDKKVVVRRGRHAAAWYAVCATFLTIPLLPFTVGTQYFPLVLAAPHVLLFLPSFGLRGDPNSVWRLYQFTYFGILVLQILSGVYVAFETTIATWATSTAADLTREFLAQTQLLRTLFPVQIFIRQPGQVQLQTLLEPLMAPYVAFLNVIEPQLSLFVGWFVSSASLAGREFIRDPLILLSWLTGMAFFVHSIRLRLESALFEHPAVSSVGLDAVLVWISGMTWLLSGGGAFRTLLGDC